MIVVSDTSPLSNLFIVNQLHLLHKIYGQIVIPEAVMNELLELEKRGIDLSAIKNAEWIKVETAISETRVTEFLKELDLGEAEAIVLANELKADWLLIDETRGRDIARAEGIKIIGLIGILLLAKERRLIPSVKNLLDEIISKAKFRVAQDLYLRALQLSGENQ